MSKRVIQAQLSAHVRDVSSQIGCVGHEHVFAAPVDGSDHPFTFSIVTTSARGFPLARRSRYWLTARQMVRVDPSPGTGEAPIEIVGYLYRIGCGEEGSQELLAYHFDPFNLESGAPYPHLHVGRSTYRPLNTGRLQDFHKRHIPTGHVTFPLVVRFLIEELGVEPINPNWERILSEAIPV